MADVIGAARCPLCSSEKARVSVSPKTKLAYLHCNACNIQLFPRSDKSDELVRALVIVAPVEKPAPAPAPIADEKPAPAAKPAKAADSWDVFA